ncbi:hypothetical protein TanjilG_27457 [Lupinus angustifolius]|uniref:Uncharacterized protein n=1 Tax=Lupinus angustifolius TaxID=3871 RepID=A0A1J7FPA8_LUPAN|nr:hypothetical protein TanjilG_27457 [Lupinus angustifolius]
MIGDQGNLGRDRDNLARDHEKLTHKDRKNSGRDDLAHERENMTHDQGTTWAWSDRGTKRPRPSLGASGLAMMHQVGASDLAMTHQIGAPGDVGITSGGNSNGEDGDGSDNGVEVKVEAISRMLVEGEKNNSSVSCWSNYEMTMVVDAKAEAILEEAVWFGQ